MAEAFSAEWEKIHYERAWGKYPSEPIIRFVARNYYNCENRNAVKILDFGCGQGAHTWYLAREGFDTYAFDGAKSAVEKAKKMLEQEGLKAHFDVVDGTDIKYADNFFDAVIDSACIGHNRIADIERMYCKIYTVLKNGGKLFTTFFSTDTTGYGTGEFLENNTYRNVTEGPLQDTGVVHFWTREEMYATLEKVGVRDIKIEKATYTDQGNLIDLFMLSATKTE